MCTLCSTSVNNQRFIYKSFPIPLSLIHKCRLRTTHVFFCSIFIRYSNPLPEETNADFLMLSRLCAFDVGRTLIWEADWLIILQEMPLSIVLSLLGCFVQGFLQTPPIWTKPILAKQTELEDEKEYLTSTQQTTKSSSNKTNYFQHVPEQDHPLDSQDKHFVTCSPNQTSIFLYLPLIVDFIMSSALLSLSSHDNPPTRKDKIQLQLANIR